MNMFLWLLLCCASLLSGSLFFFLAIPAPFFVAAMLCGLIFGLAGSKLALPRTALLCAQALIGGAVAKSITANVWHTLASHWLLMGAMVGCSILAGALVGWALMKSGIIPGTTAAWGSTPGGAAAMVSMAEAYGADVHLVALMQYLRVMLVVLSASAVAHLLSSSRPHAEIERRSLLSLLRFQELPPQWLLTLAIICLCGLIAYRLRIPSGSLLLTMIVGAILNANGLVDFRLPNLFQTAASVLLGWYVGLGFNRQLLCSALRLLHWLFLSAILLILLCAACSWLLHHFAACDLLTAYLATTPGGLDSVLLMAMDSHTDLPFVIATQSLRLFTVILIGPMIARFLCRWA